MPKWSVSASSKLVTPSWVFLADPPKKISNACRRTHDGRWHSITSFVVAPHGTFERPPTLSDTAKSAHRAVSCRPTPWRKSRHRADLGTRRDHSPAGPFVGWVGNPNRWVVYFQLPACDCSQSFPWLVVVQRGIKRKGKWCDSCRSSDEG